MKKYSKTIGIDLFFTISSLILLIASFCLFYYQINKYDIDNSNSGDTNFEKILFIIFWIYAIVLCLYVLIDSIINIINDGKT